MKTNLEVEFDGDDMYVVRNGRRIAKPGHHGTSQAKQWIALEPGVYVYDDDPNNPGVIVVEYKGQRSEIKRRAVLLLHAIHRGGRNCTIR